MSTLAGRESTELRAASMSTILSASKDAAICIIVPPGSGGVADFSARLAEGLRLKFHTVPVEIVPLPYNTRAISESWQRDRILLIQYSGYSFQKRGAPFWLLRVANRLKRSGVRIGCFFHELYAFGPPWRSSFWFSPLQRLVAAELAGISEFWMTNRASSAKWLEGVAKPRPHAVLPVFSTIGEAKEFKSPRQLRVVVFGSPGLRRATYVSGGERLFAWVKRLGLEVHDLGADLNDHDLAGSLRHRGVVFHGRLSSDGVCSLLSDAMYGLIAYPAGALAKSSVFAAYCTHGICPIVFSDEYEGADKLQPGVHYLTRDLPNTFSGAELVGGAAWTWYQRHSVRSHVDVLAQFIGSNV